VKSGAS